MPKQKPYRQLKAELEEVLEKMQDSDIDLDEAIILHEEAKKLITELEKYLKQFEKKVGKTSKSSQ